MTQARKRPTLVIVVSLSAFALTAVWGLVALVVADYGHDPAKLERCGASLSYGFLSVVAAVGFVAGAASVVLALGYVHRRWHGKYLVATLATTALLFAIWALIGGLSAFDCALSV